MKVEQYLELPYTVTLRRDEDGDWVARILELEGCTAHGKTKPEALENLDEVQRVWIEDALEAGDSIPTPAEDEPLPSGKWLQRTPRSLHAKLVAAAKKEEVSLNQLVTSILSEAIGKRHSTADTLATEMERYHEMWDSSTHWGRYCGQSSSQGLLRNLLVKWLYLSTPEWEIKQPALQAPLVVWQNLVTARAHHEKIKVVESGKTETGKKEDLRHGYYANV